MWYKSVFQTFSWDLDIRHIPGFSTFLVTTSSFLNLWAGWTQMAATEKNIGSGDHISYVSSISRTTITNLDRRPSKQNLRFVHKVNLVMIKCPIFSTKDLIECKFSNQELWNETNLWRRIREHDSLSRIGMSSSQRVFEVFWMTNRGMRVVVTYKI